MATTFTDTFGGSPISPSEVAYAAYSFATNFVLYWPQFSYGQTDVSARFMNLTATNNSLHVSMPDATLVSVGFDTIIFNAGLDTFNVVDFNGGAIATITAGQTYYLILNDNTTQAGGWQTVQFGVGTGSASAAALAGAGLLAIANKLNVNTTATSVSGSYTITSAQRGVLQVWTGGSGTITLPTASSVGNGFFFPFANNGSGSVTISAGDNIDGASTEVFTQTQSGFIISTGSTWYTVGKGTATNFAVTILNLNVAGSSDVTETSAQAQNVIQQFTGIITGNINIIVPNTVQLYYIFNDTTGAFTLTVKTAAGSGITVDQSSHTILYCDGTNVVNAFTSTFGGGITLGAGSAGSPNLNFAGSTATGIYSPSANQFAITAGGKEVMNFISDASAVNWLETEATATGNAPTITAKGSDTNIGIILVPKGSGAVGMSAAVILSGTIDGTIIGGSSAAAITGTTITGSSLVGPLTGNVTGNVTGNASTATALVTPRAIYGNNFDGTAALTQIIASNFGGTGNGFTKFAGPTTAEKTFTLPDSSSTLLYAGGPLGTPSSGVATNLTGTASGLTAGNVTTNANLTGAIISTGNATSLGSFTSTQLASALTDETGTGSAVFSNNCILVSPALGAASATSLVINGGTVIGNFVESTYTPTTFNTTNITSSTPQVTNYMRIGNTVTVWGQITVQFAASANSVLGVSLPIASNIAASGNIGGTAYQNTSNNNGFGIEGDVTNDRALFRCASTGAITGVFDFLFAYKVI